ncbi:MAG: transposase [Pseudonocardiales bacterium]|nr:transposase [Pseudonocardiales bacterium]
MLEGMPEPADLRRTEVDGKTVITVGARVIACFDTTDVGMRNITVQTLTQTLRFTGRRVAQVMGLTPEYVSELRGRARREGSAGLVQTRGRPRKLRPAEVDKALAWREQGLSAVAIGRRLGVADTTVGRALAPRSTPAAAGPDSGDPQPTLEPVGQPEPAPGQGEPAPERPESGPEQGESSSGGAGSGAQPVVASGRLEHDVVTSRYAGAMLLHAFYDRIAAQRVFASLTHPAGARFDDVALLTATTCAFALGVSSMEATKHLIRTQIGPLAGLDRLPTLRTLRPRLAALAQGCDPLELQAKLAQAMVAADAPLLNLYFVDDHFVPYEGAKPLAKGYSTKRRHAQKGLADTLVTDYGGRAVCFVTGPPSGLTKTLPAALAELRKVTGPAKIMLGFDRGGAYASVFAHCRDTGVDWLTYRRGGLAPVTTEPVRYWLGSTDGPSQCVTLADETVTINDYGSARQLTLFEDGQPRLQVLTSDLTAPAAALLAWLRCRWRIENVFKYLTAHHSIDWLCHYGADTGPDTTPIDNPARKKARAALKAAETTLSDAQRELAELLGSDQSVTAKNAAIPAAQTKIATAQRAVATARQKLKTIPAKIPANQHNPHAQRAILRTQRRSLQMVLRLLAFNAEYWLADRLNTYLTDNDEYRATLRHLLHLGGTITYTTTTITVALDTPTTPKITQALRLLIEELNTTPPHIPGDPRPITYQLQPN